MELKVCREDKNFLKAQRRMYEKFLEDTRMEAQASAKLPDKDLTAHLDQLEAFGLKGADF